MTIFDLLASLRCDPWAMLPERMAALTETARKMIAAGRDLPEVKAEEGQGAAPLQGAVAVLPIRGVLMHRPSYLLQRYFGVSDTAALHAQFSALVQRDDVRAIVLDIDSPGGSVVGVHEFAEAIYKARASKKIVAASSGMAASAAYHLASQAHEIVVSHTSGAGSIGVYTSHFDVSEAEKINGFKTTLISAGKYKTEGNPFEPLSEEARAAIQHNVDYFYNMFVAAVARGRGVKASDVKNGYGQGRYFSGKQAIEEGLADRVGSVEGVVKELSRGSTNLRARRLALAGL